MLPVSKLEERPPLRNRLLATLAWREYARLRTHLEEVGLSYKDVLHEPGAAVEWVYFPEETIVSLLSVGEQDAAIEVGMVGDEGMVGAPILLGSSQSPYQAVVLRPGAALRARAETIKREFKRSRELREQLLPYAHALLTQSAQSAACHRFHTPLERLCRWLLMVHDRAGSDQFRATQEFISDQLGTRRATVTEAAHGLQQRGIIDYRRGQVHMRDRAALERLVCRCYFVIKQEFDQLGRA